MRLESKNATVAGKDTQGRIMLCVGLDGWWEGTRMQGYHSAATLSHMIREDRQYIKLCRV
jgi:hypothetical protein